MAFAANEKNACGQLNPWSQKRMILAEENYRATTDLLQQHLWASPIKVALFIDHVDDFHHFKIPFKDLWTGE